MPIPRDFQLALEAFDLDGNTESARAEVWTLLEPTMNQAVRNFTERTNRIAPYYREMPDSVRLRHNQMIFEFTERLFKGTFDEHWVSDTKKRASEEVALGFDLRNRGLVAHCILTLLKDTLGSRHRFSGNKVTRLFDIAARVLLMDISNTAVIHHNGEVRNVQIKANKLDSAIVSFGHTVEGVRRAVGSAVVSLTHVSSQLTTFADNAAGHASTGSQAANTAAVNISCMAASTEELSASIAEIRRQASMSAAQATDAESGAKNMNQTIALLSGAVKNISSVVGVISKIADQTNLLALNATIEAARAGDKGKGFAVVASEVKALAHKTSSATKHIGEKIEFIEDITRKSVDEIGATSCKIAETARISKLLECAVTDQAAATNSIAQSADVGAQNATEAASSLKTVAVQIRSTQDTSKLIIDLAKQLSECTQQMDSAMDTLLQASSQNAEMKKLVDLQKGAAA